MAYKATFQTIEGLVLGVEAVDRIRCGDGGHELPPFGNPFFSRN
jgi:hypothetical protein